MGPAIALALALTCARARADGGAVGAIAAPETATVVARLDAMLPQPTTPLAISLVPDTEPFAALVGAPTRYVIILRATEVAVFDLETRRTAARALEAELVARDPYAAAMIALELLEVVGAVDPDALEGPPRDDAARPEAPAEVAEEAPSETGAQRRVVTLALGGLASRGLGGDVDLLAGELAGGIELPVGRRLLSLGASLRFPARMRQTFTTSAGTEVRFDYTRTDLALRVGIGGDDTRVGYRATAMLGPSRVHVRARTGEASPRTGADTRASAFFGLALEGRLIIVPSLALYAAGGIAWLPGATPYGALGEMLLDEPRFRLEGSVGLVWRIGA